MIIKVHTGPIEKNVKYHCNVFMNIMANFLFHGLHFATTHRVLKTLSCFHMTSFNYSAKEVRDVDSACRCHQSNIIPDSIFSVNIARCVTCLFVFCFILFYVCIGEIGDILGYFYSQRPGAQFYHYYINGLGETLSYNGQRQIGLISFN